MAMNQLSGINTVMYYSTTILVEAGFSRHASLWLAALCCAAQLLGVGVSVASMDTAGRRSTALRSCVGVVITLSSLATSFWLPGKSWGLRQGRELDALPRGLWLGAERSSLGHER
eukprot:SRR837773.26640.p1 GENE.SRR837773.26640~~SRR837773.26640.p1  ORF type:complete len:115 (-),score=15.90 SRR837773.26640:7-351(-)